MLRPFLLIGVGGSGGKTLRIVHHELERLLREIGWEEAFPAGWQFLHVDVPSVADGDDPDLPPQLAHGEYAGLVTAGVNYRNIDMALAGGVDRTEAGDAIAGWRPLPHEVNVPVERGAGQFRALGRVITLANLRSAKTHLDAAIRNINGREVTAQLMELTKLTGGIPESLTKPPVAVVVSSIAGGSGAGAVIDICDLLRATGGGVWASESMGILYSPDVFDYLDPARRRGVRPNALATVSELMAGYWNKQGPSKETANILNRQGVAVGDIDRLGPRYSFLVGAKNESVTYRTQNDIYHAMGRSIASWVTSTSLQDRMDAYVSGNWSASAIAVPDELRLKTNEMETPFTALGSARVGLGRDRFRDYAAQRLARAAVELLLTRHEKTRIRGDERNSRMIAQELADQRFPAFLIQSKLNERTEEKNDILDSIRPTDREDVLKTLSAQILNQVTGQAPANGLSVAEWRSRISQKVRELIDRQLDEFDVANRECGRTWVKEVQAGIRLLAAQSLAMEGYVVTGILFRKLVEELRAVRTELEQEISKYQRAGENVEGEIESALRTADGDVLPANHPNVNRAVKSGVGAIHYRSEARLRQLVVGLLPDLVDNVIVRVAEEIERAGQALSNEKEPQGGQPSIVAAWPDGDEVPKVLRPAANEFLLESPETYGDSLRAIIARTVEVEDSAGALDRVLRYVIMGAEDHDKDNQSLVRQPAAWTPRQHELHLELSTPQRASFDIAMSAEELLDRALAWLMKPGTPSGSFVRESLKRYFDADHTEPAERSKRLDRFEQQFAAAVDAAQPLVGIRKSVLVAVHGRNEVRSDTFFTELPFSASSDEAKAVRRVLETKGLWNEDVARSFNPSDRGSIDAFTVLVEPYEPVVFDSLMRPIAEEWGDRSKSADGREEFWRWRRARSLPEFIPTSPAVRKAMVRGWFTASILGQIKFDDSSVSLYIPNPVGSSGNWRSFPVPLLASGVAASHDYLPLALESLPLALVDVNVKADLTPMAPYRRLRDLGTSGGGGLDAYESAVGELEAWVRRGELPHGASAPAEAHAGCATGEWSMRQQAVVERATSLLGIYQDLFATVEKRNEISVPRAYELRVEIISALSEIARAAGEITGDAGADAWN
jgi:hypothetical protein